MTLLAGASLASAILASAGCAGRVAPSLPPTVADSISSERVAPGVMLHHLVRRAGPLRAHVLDIDLTQCLSLRAVKGFPTAVGRRTTSELLAGLPAESVPIAAVNADFFTFTPNGVPVNALVEEGRLFTGPVKRPVLAFDSAGRPFIGAFTSTGEIVTVRGTVALQSWNRPAATTVGIVDAAWGQALDTLVRPVARLLVPVGDASVGTALGARRYTVRELPTAHDGIARGDSLLLVARSSVPVRTGDTVRVHTGLAPFFPRNAVGGQPLLVHDSVISPSISTDGAASFRDRNPRTAAGFARDGRRLLLVVIDGRQPGVSVGTSTLETAQFMRDIGAREAINLDGGGSTAMVLRDRTTGRARVVNKPSDPTERPVGDALALVGSCRGR